VHDLVSVVVFLILFFGIVFFFPTGGGYFLEAANFEPANPLKTPVHIAPVWYFTPFYAILRAIPDQLGGVIALAGAVAIPFLLPILDRSPVKSMRYKGRLSRIALGIFVVSFLVLGILGMTPADHPIIPFINNQLLAQFFTLLYFLYFLLMPFYTGAETYRLPPDRVTGGRK